jgi:ketosteroid isomerase-like protein
MDCVAPGYHTLADDREIDRDGLAAQLKSLLDPLRNWELEVALVEIPQPVLHPDGILVYTELEIAARDPDSDERRSWVHRRIAVFEQQRDRSWRIAALSAI